MHIGDTPDEAEWRATCRSWLEANAVPKGHPDDFSAGMFGHLSEADYIERARKWQATVHDAGFAAIAWPKAFGGQGKAAIHQAIYNQEQAQFGVTSGPFLISIGMAGPTIMRHGSNEQRARFLGPMLRGEELWCQLFSEPGAGSDLAGLSTVAVRDGDEFVVRGQKVWTSATSRAQWGMLLARTNHAVPKRAGISYFLLDMSSTGIDARPLRQMTGDAHFSEVFLDDVRIPAANLLGEVDDGWTAAKTTLTAERGAIAGGSAGVDASALIDMAQRVADPTDQLVRQKLVDAHIRQELLRFFRYRTLTALSQGRQPGSEASLMKMAYSKHLPALTGLALELQGATAMLTEGLPDDGKWTGRFLHSPSMRIAGGSDEVQRNIVGEQILGLPREPSVEGH